jgi:hypothetical protein
MNEDGVNCPVCLEFFLTSLGLKVHIGVKHPKAFALKK